LRVENAFALPFSNFLGRVSRFNSLFRLLFYVFRTTRKIKILNLHYARLIPFPVSRVSGAHLSGFAPRPTLQGCNGGESLATCGRFDRLGDMNPIPLAPEANFLPR